MSIFTRCAVKDKNLFMMTTSVNKMEKYLESLFLVSLQNKHPEITEDDFKWSKDAGYLKDDNVDLYRCGYLVHEDGTIEFPDSMIELDVKDYLMDQEASPELKAFIEEQHRIIFEEYIQENDWTWYFPSVFKKIRLHNGEDYYEDYTINAHDQLCYLCDDLYYVGFVIGCSSVRGQTHYTRVIENMGYGNYERGPCNDCWGTPFCGKVKFVPLAPGEKTMVFLPGKEGSMDPIPDMVFYLYAPE